MSDRERPELVSVVIPTYNRAALIGRAISSALAQTYENLEILIVDDGSNDDTESVVHSFQDARIRYLRRRDNRGAATSRNEGVEAARGDFVAYLDSDDTWQPTKIAQQMAQVHVCADPGSVVCYSQLTLMEGDKARIMPQRGKRSDEPVIDYLLSNEGAIYTPTLLLPRMLARATPFDPKYRVKEDWDVLLRLEDAGASWEYVPEPLATYHRERSLPRLSGTSTPEENLHWLRAHQSKFSAATVQRFMLGPVLQSIIARGEKRRYGVRIVVDALRTGAVKPSEATGLLTDIAFRRFGRNLLRRLPQRT